MIRTWWSAALAAAVLNAPGAAVGKPAERGMLGFAAGFLAPEAAAWLKDGKLELSYTDYDWNLNDAGR